LESGCDRRSDSDQRAADDDRRRRAGGVLWHDTGRAAIRVRAGADVAADAAADACPRQSVQLLALSIRPAQAGRNVAAGAAWAELDLSADPGLRREGAGEK